MWSETASMVETLGNPSVSPQQPLEDSTVLPNRSLLVHFVHLCGSAVFAPEAAGWSDPELRPRLFDHVKNVGSRLKAMPYDKRRMQVFMEVVTAAINAH